MNIFSARGVQGVQLMIMMKLPILPCAEKLELVLSTAAPLLYQMYGRGLLFWPTLYVSNGGIYGRVFPDAAPLHH